MQIKGLIQITDFLTFTFLLCIWLSLTLAGKIHNHSAACLLGAITLKNNRRANKLTSKRTDTEYRMVAITAGLRFFGPKSNTVLLFQNLHNIAYDSTFALQFPPPHIRAYHVASPPDCEPAINSLFVLISPSVFLPSQPQWHICAFVHVPMFLRHLIVFACIHAFIYLSPFSPFHSCFLTHIF